MTEPPADSPWPRRGWYVLGLLATVNFLNYGNRIVLFPMYEDLRASFGFSNAELGLLGTAFMLTHALFTIPLGWAGDRFDRRRVMALGMVVWSLAAIGSAAAAGMGSMLLSRALCGAGTAACVPVANALLCDVFPDRAKARTVSVFNLGLFLGGAAGFGFGAWLGFPLGFVALGLPGLVLAVLVDRLGVPPRRAHASDVMTWAGFRRDAIAIMSIPTMRWLLLASVLMAFATGGYLAWFADFVAREKGMSIEKATAVFGGAALTGGLAGVLAGGAVADYLARRVAYGRLVAISIGFAVTVPFALLSIFVDGGPVFYASTWLTMFFITWYHGPVAATVDDLMADERATTGQAGFIFAMHFFGTAPSSYVVGVIADGIGLRLALLVPTVAIGAAALVNMRAWPTAAADIGNRARAAL